jgi:transposase
MKKDITFGGLDVHKEMITVALLLPGRKEPLEWQCHNEPAAIRQLAKRLIAEAGGREDVELCYEAGPCGYALQRELKQYRVSCVVVAPSLIPKKSGDRVKTDRRDARKLAELLRAGLLTSVAAPTPAEETVRDLCRCREDAKRDLLAAHHRLLKFLLRRGLCFAGRTHWGAAHRRWLKGLHLADPLGQQVMETYLGAIEQIEERLKSLLALMEEVAQRDEYRAAVGVLRTFRGIKTVTALSLVAELYGFPRFAKPRELMAYLGLTPSEYSSGERRRRGGITKTGNGHVRRLLVEAAWSSRNRPLVSAELRRRRVGAPPWAVKLADKALHRLHRRYLHLVFKGKPANKAVTAVARELAGFVWAALTTLHTAAGAAERT